MTTTKQTYKETTNLEYEALYIARTCLDNNIPFAINPAQREREDRYNIIINYTEENQDIIMAMDTNLKSGQYEGHGLNFHELSINQK